MQCINSLKQYESTFREKYSNKVIAALLKRFGIDVQVIRKKVPASASQQNPAANAGPLSQAAFDVFGDFSSISAGKAHFLDKDPTVNVKFQARILIATIPTDPFDAASSGMLEKQIVYTNDDLNTNDLIMIDCDKTKKRLIVGQPLEVGLTTFVYKKFEVNNFGGLGPGQ